MGLPAPLASHILYPSIVSKDARAVTPFAELVQHSATAAWLFIPSAILLGAPHGRERNLRHISRRLI